MQLDCVCCVKTNTTIETSQCIVNLEYAVYAEPVAYIYGNEDYKDSLLVCNCSFSEIVPIGKITIETSNENITKWDDQTIHIILIPKYYLFPWKSILCGVSELIMNDYSEQSILKKKLSNRIIKKKDSIDQWPICCIHKQQSINKLHDEKLSYIIDQYGYCDKETQIVFQSSLFYPPIPSNQQFYRLPQCTWKELQAVYPTNSYYHRNHSHLEEILTWNEYVYKNTSCFIQSKELPFESSSILIKGSKGSGKSSLLYDLLEQHNLPCFILHAYNMVIQSGSDAAKMMESIYHQCQLCAPCILLIDPLQVIAAENSNKRMERSDVDNACLMMLSYILKDSKKNGVTVIGMCIDETTLLPSICHQFDEVIECSQPNQHERLSFLHYISSCYLEYESNDWFESYLQYLALHTPSFSWSDLTMAVIQALHQCKHSQDKEHCCCLCLLQTIQQATSSIAIFNDISSIVYPKATQVFTTLPDFTSLVNDFSSIGGNKQLKQYLTDLIINPSLQQTKYQHYHIQPSTGILLYGPPGTGKTAIARICAQLGHFNFICPEISELICKEVGESERRIRELFSKAKKASPCILFFDEIESIFKNRKNAETSTVSGQLLTQLLLQIDSLHSDEETFDLDSFVFIIGATNLPNLLDPSLLRPGRLDRLVLVPLPNIDEREEIIHIYADQNLIFPETYTIHQLAEKTEGYSGADIKYLVRYITLHSIDFTKETLESTKICVTENGIRDALFIIKPTTNKIEYEKIVKWKPEDNYSIVF